MKKIIYLFIFTFSLLNTHLTAEENKMILKLKYGEVEIELYPENSLPRTGLRFKTLVTEQPAFALLFLGLLMKHRLQQCKLSRVQ